MPKAPSLLALALLTAACSRTPAKADPPVVLDNECVVPPPGVMGPKMEASRAKSKPIDFAAAAAAAPATAGEFQRGEVSQYDRPAAGHPTDTQNISYADTHQETVLFGIEDKQHVCHLSKGLGTRLRDAYVKNPMQPGFKPINYQGWPAAEGSKSLRVWVGDRCEMFVNAGTIAKARTVGDALDWAALGKVCRARD